MKDVIRFLIFIIYTTSVFFISNNKIILLFILINFIVIICKRIKLKRVIIRSIQILPFIVFTFIINYILDNYVYAFWVGIKLFLVCNITIIYSEITSTASIAEAVKILCFPLKLFKINTDEIRIIVYISLAMFPILKKELFEVKEACIAKNIKFNIRNMKIILGKFFLLLIFRVNKIEDALIAKGYYIEE